MARKIISYPKWRLEERKKLRKLPDADLRRAAKEEIAVRLERESFKRAFKRLRIESRAKQKKLELRLFDAKVRAVRKLNHDLTLDEARHLARTRTVLKFGEVKKREEEVLYVAFGKKTDDEGRPRFFRRGREVTLRNGRRVIEPYGRVLRAGRVNQIKGLHAYVARTKTLQKAFGVTYREAQKLDRIMLEVPEKLRKRIYEEVLRKFGRR